MTDLMTTRLEQVRALSHELRDLEGLTKDARIALYRSVSLASAEGCRTMDIAAAAQWRTKKAVYDACRAVGEVTP